MPREHRRLAIMAAALLLASTGTALTQSGSSGGSSSGGAGTSSGASSSSPGATSSPGTAASPGSSAPSGGTTGPTVRAPSSNPSAVAPPSVAGTPSSNPSAAQQPTVAVPATRPGCNPSQQAGSPSIAGTGTIGTASVSGGGVTARHDNQVTNEPQAAAPSPTTGSARRTAGSSEKDSQTTGARGGGSVDTGTPRIANDPSLGTGRTVQTNPGAGGISSVTGTPGTPSAASPGTSGGRSSATGC